MGDPDYDVGAYTYEGRVLAFPADGTGTLTANDAVLELVGSLWAELGQEIVSGDLDGDGDVELLIAGNDSYTAWLFSTSDWR